MNPKGNQSQIRQSTSKSNQPTLLISFPSEFAPWMSTISTCYDITSCLFGNCSCESTSVIALFGYRDGRWTLWVIESLDKWWCIRPKNLFWGCCSWGSSYLSHRGGSSKSICLENHCFQVYRGSITGSVKTRLGLTRKLGTLSGSTCFVKFSTKTI